MQNKPLTPFLEGGLDRQRIGCRNHGGPVAEIKFDEDWLWIITDAYEGVTMLNIETLPLLIKALKKIQNAQNA